jgi:hypothetical protein
MYLSLKCLTPILPGWVHRVLHILTASGEARLTPLTDDAYVSSSLLTADHIATIDYVLVSRITMFSKHRLGTKMLVKTHVAIRILA